MTHEPVVVDASKLDALIEAVSQTSDSYIRIAENIDAVVPDIDASRVIHEMIQKSYVSNQALLAQLRLLQRLLDRSVGNHPSNGRRPVALAPNVFLLERTSGSGDA